MHIIVNCTDCTRQLRLPQETLGSTVRCPLCKAIFMTRSTPDGGAEAIRVAPKSASDPPSQPPPARKSSPALPDLNLELDDRRPAPPPPRPPDKPTYDIVMEALPAEDDRPGRRPRRDEDDDDRRSRRPSYRDEDDRDRDREDDEEEAPARRRAEGAFAAFQVFVHSDPEERLIGSFDAEVGPDGLEMWRGRGRTLPVPVGARVEYLGGARLLLEVDGRQVELSVLDPQEQHEELARGVADFLAKKADTVEPPKRTVGPAVWVALAPLAVPLLALLFGNNIAGAIGMILWFVLAALLGVASLPILLKKNWPAGSRVAGALGVSSIGLGILLIALAFDTRKPAVKLIDMPWAAFAPLDSGYRVEMPGHPGPYQTQKYGVPPSATARVYELAMPDYKTWFFVSHGEPFGPGGGRADADLVNQARSELSSRNVGSRVQSEQNITVGNHQGKEVHLRTSEGHDLVARVIGTRGRVFVAMIATTQLKPNGPEVRKFLDSLALDPTTGWPAQVAGGPGPGGPDIKPPEQKGEALADGGKIVFTPDRAVAWAGFAREGGSFAAVTVDGQLSCFDSGGAFRSRGRLSLNAGEEVVGAGWSPDGKLIYVMTNQNAMAPYVVADTQFGTKRQSSFRTTQIVGVAVAGDNATLATARGFFSVGLWDLKNYTEAASLQAEGTVHCVAFSPDNKLLAVGTADGPVRVYDQQRAKQADLTGHVARAIVGSVAFSRDNNTLVSASHDRTARVWDVKAKRQQHALVHESAVRAVAFHPAGRVFATGTAEGRLRVFDAGSGFQRSGTGRVNASGEPLQEKEIRHLSFSADGRHLLVALKGRVELWHVERRFSLFAQDRIPVQPTTTPPTPTETGRPVAVNTLLFPLADAVVDVKGGKAFVCSAAGTFLYQYTYPALSGRTTSRLDRMIYRIALDAEAEKLYVLRATRIANTATGARGEDAELLEIATNSLSKTSGKVPILKPRQRLSLGSIVSQLVLTPDRKALLYLDHKNKRVGRVDAATLKDDGHAELNGDPGGMALTPDGKLLYVVSAKGDLGQLEVFSGTSLRALRIHKLPFKPDEVVATNDQQVWIAGSERTQGPGLHALYDEGKELKQLRQFRNQSVSLRLGPEGKGVFVIPRQNTPFTATYYPLRADRKLVAGTELPLSSTLRVVHGATAVATPDGKHLLFDGAAYRLPPLGK